MTVIPSNAVHTERLRIVLHGFVQGVGFRPTVYRLAEKLHVAGWVRHSGAGLEIEVEGSSDQLKHFLNDLKRKKPVAAEVTREEVSRIAPSGAVWFEILPGDEVASDRS
ncbi:MAG TPA: acylphosphatase [Candidatus Sulfotelmatobacter sp.]|nr:acylphosphatase [Candidatus Sulfotelmatobacter sp.]